MCLPPQISQTLMQMKTFRSSIVTQIGDLAESLPPAGSLSQDQVSNALVYLAQAYKELGQLPAHPEIIQVMGRLRKIFSTLLYFRAVTDMPVDETYLTKIGRLNYENEDPD